MEHNASHKKKKKKSAGTKAAIAILSACVVLLLVAGGLVAYGMATGKLFTGSGTGLFKSASVPTPTPEPTAMAVEIAPDFTPVPTPTPEPTPYVPTQADLEAELASGADLSMTADKDILNIMFIGVDYEEARTEKTWSGKSGNSFHSDVMMVCAVNFTENRVDLISLPRDTYAEIPGVEGIYKLNASLNCGTDGTYYGLFAEHGEGFEKVCEAAEWMLGDAVPIDYYYAVTLDSVKEIIDIIGGVDYDLEGDFDNGGRYYKKGFQHMDGQACLDYMRVRKSGHGTLSTSDQNRINRQKSMLVALFKTVKEKNLIVKIPELLASFSGGLYTNCSIAQTAALAVFGLGLDPADIGMYSIGGTTATLFHWNFVLTDQENRVDVIKKVYGISVSEKYEYSLAYGRYRWAELLKSKYLKNCQNLDKYVSGLLADEDPDEDVYEEPQAYSGDEVEPYVEPHVGDDTEQLSSAGAGTVSRLAFRSAPVLQKKYSASDKEKYEEFKAAYKELKSKYSSCESRAKKGTLTSSNSKSLLEQMATTQDLAIEVANAFGYTKTKNFTVKCHPTDTYKASAWSLSYWTDSSFNEVSVNFN